MLIAYKRDFTEAFNIPHGMFGIEDKNLWMMESVYVPDAFETYFNIYLNKFINEIRESPETKKVFFDELKQVYYKDVKKDMAEMKEHCEQMEAQNFDDETE